MSPIPEQLKKFLETPCPCCWIITTPKHSKKDCPHYTFADELAFLESSLLAAGKSPDDFFKELLAK